MLAQEREIAEKRLNDERRRLAGDIRQELLSHLERIKLQALRWRAGGAVQSTDAGEQHRAIALVASVEDGHLALPWDRDARAGAFAAAVKEPRFAEEIQVGERDELVRKTLQAPFGATNIDEQGIPLSLYAARRLLDGGHSDASDRHLILEILRAELAREPPLPPAAVYMLGDLADSLGANTTDGGARQALIDVHQAISARTRDAEQALALQNAFSTLMPRPMAGPAGADQVWVSFGAEKNLWLVTLTSSSSDVAPLVIALRADPVLTALGSLHTNLGGQGHGMPPEVQANSSGEPLGSNFPGLSLSFPAIDADALAREGSLQRSFYLAALLLVLSVALSGGYLFWRDVRRELHVSEMRSQFVSSVSHELKTPLTAIRMFGETLLMGRAAQPETRDEYLETIVSESERLTRLLNNVLDFSKIEQGQKIYRLEPQPLAEIVHAAARAMQYPLSQQGFELRVKIDDDLPLVPADSDAIQQAILNLLSNAMKYSGQGRVIDLELKHDGGQATIAVTDRGLGIAAGEQTRIFEKFYRVPSADNQLIPGTGLGLTLVDHVARAHRGRVTLRSAPGEGSTFSIVLPLTDAGAHALTAAKPLVVSRPA
jgi:signal transduction histidine kinase